LYARNVLGMRSITHLLAVEVAKKVKNDTWTKKFFSKLFHRPDDMTEIVSCYIKQVGKRPLPNSLKKAIRHTLENLSEYSLAKYRAEKKEVKLVDLVNLTHPKANSALTKLVKGELKSTNTWETKLTQAGQVAETEEEKKTLKADAWKSLLEENKLGYFALLRNLCNILEQAPDLIDLTCERLVNRDAIKQSLVLPFRYATAYNLLLNRYSKQDQSIRKVLKAINDAAEISLDNCPTLNGNTLVVVDTSGSMRSFLHKPAILAAAFAKKNNSDILCFGSGYKYISYSPADSLFSITEKILRSDQGGTDFSQIFKGISNRKYNRILIFSDMQGWSGDDSELMRDFHSYCKVNGSVPFMYSWDVAGYGTLKFPERNVFLLAGFSEKIFDIMKMCENEKDSLIKEIESISF